MKHCFSLLVFTFLAGCSQQTESPVTVDISQVTPQAPIVAANLDQNAIWEEAVQPKTFSNKPGVEEIVERGGAWVDIQTNPEKIRVFKNIIAAGGQGAKGLAGDTANVRAMEWLDKACDAKIRLLEKGPLAGASQDDFSKAIIQARINAKVGALTPSP